MRGHSLFILFLLGLQALSQDMRSVVRAQVDFISEAPMERVSASTDQCAGVIDLKQRTFAVQVPVRSFQGFNSPLQREHFNENYLESTKFPSMTFQGRIIESTDLSKPGTYRLRAKGDFTVHGVMQERIIECVCVVTDAGLRVTSQFNVELDDHAIRVPRVVQPKLSSTVQVRVDLRFGPKQSLPR
jgi:hypothetical protein